MTFTAQFVAGPIGWFAPARREVVIIAGPLGGDQDEAIVAPIYWGDEDGFRASDGDVHLDPFGSRRAVAAFAACWNARPLPLYSIELTGFRVSTESLDAVQDVYWSGMANDAAPSKLRIGTPLRFWERKAILFQANEVRAWARYLSEISMLAEISHNRTQCEFTRSDGVYPVASLVRSNERDRPDPQSADRRLALFA